MLLLFVCLFVCWKLRCNSKKQRGFAIRKISLPSLSYIQATWRNEMMSLMRVQYREREYREHEDEVSRKWPVYVERCKDGAESSWEPEGGPIIYIDVPQ